MNNTRLDNNKLTSDLTWQTDLSTYCLDGKSVSQLSADQGCNLPPSGYNTWPLRKRPPGPARYKIAAAISASLPLRSRQDSFTMVSVQDHQYSGEGPTSWKTISHAVKLRLLILVRGVGRHLTGKYSGCDTVDPYFALC